MEEDAQAYDELNQPQTEIACKFIRELNLSQGHKVLDMGCGTGTATKYVADIVGPDGQVVGVDPDAARIKIAQEKFKQIGNLQFHVGSSVTGFPHDIESYYDAHISTFVFQWPPNDEKKVYVQKAHQSLKSGGKLAISCTEKAIDHDSATGENPLTQDGYEKLFQEVGLFPNVVIERTFCLVKFKSFEEFKRWFKASYHRELDEAEPAFVKQLMRDYITIGGDGVVTLSNYPKLSITATKIRWSKIS